MQQGPRLMPLTAVIFSILAIRIQALATLQTSVSINFCFEYCLLTLVASTNLCQMLEHIVWLAGLLLTCLFLSARAGPLHDWNGDVKKASSHDHWECIVGKGFTATMNCLA